MVPAKICKIIACIAVSTSALQSFKKWQQESQFSQSAGEGEGEVETNPPVPVYRYFYNSWGKSNHHLSLSPNTPAGYAYEGIEFYAYKEQAPNTVPIYEIYNHGVVDHSYSTSAETFGGYTQPSIVFYAYETAVGSAKPIYHYLRYGHDNFVTRQTPCPSGYDDKGIAFYAYVPYECDCPEEPAGLCSAWGDPHYSASFYAGNAHMDHYGLGVYQLAASTDGSFEVQVFQCPWMDGAIGTSVISGYAIKAGSTIVNIVKDKVYVNDEEVDMDAVKFPRLTGPMTGSPAEGGFCINSAVGCAKMHYMPQPVNPGFETSFSIQIAENMTAKTGVCAVEACKDKPWGNCKIECGASLFTSAAITMQTQMCGMPEDCSTPADYDPPDGPDDACERGGGVSTVPCDKSVAESFCNDVPEDKRIGCMIDFCSGGCNPDIVIPSSPTPPAPITIVSTPSPPTPVAAVPTPAPTVPPTAPPTALPTTPVPQCTNCGPRPMECWATCGGKRGYCSACDSLSGRRGACCYQGGPSDPPAPPSDEYADECQTVDPAQFVHTGYHMCVLPNV